MSSDSPIRRTGVYRRYGAGGAGFVCFCVCALALTDDSVKFVCYMAAALLASPFKVSLPGGTLSVNFLFTLLGILELSLPETLLIGLVSTLGQFYWRPARRLQLDPTGIQSVAGDGFGRNGYGAYKFVSIHVLHGPGPLALVVAAVTHFAVNTLATSTIIGLTEDKPFSKVWMILILVVPLLHGGRGGGGTGQLPQPPYRLAVVVAWSCLPIYLMYRSYRLYLGKLETEKKHAEQVSNLHLRTIEALALAIEAKDQTTGEHLQRVRDLRNGTRQRTED